MLFVIIGCMASSADWLAADSSGLNTIFSSIFVRIEFEINTVSTFERFRRHEIREVHFN